jgi:hypothetical protein
MKTPREIILEQHRDAEAKLGQIRAEDLAAIARETKDAEARPHRPFHPWRLAANFWDQAILPWRRAWIGIAAVWFGIFTLNLLTHSTPNLVAARSARMDPPAVRAALREQRQLMAQLLAPAIAVPETRPKNPGPRSSLRFELPIV